MEAGAGIMVAVNDDSMGSSPSDQAAATPRRSSVSSTSTVSEFEFWSSSSMVNSSDQFSSSSFLTADELFVDGVLLPLHLLSLPTTNYKNDNHVQEETNLHEIQLNSNDNPTTTAAAAAAVLDEKCKEQLNVVVIEHEQEQKQRDPESPSIASITSCLAPVSASKRWRDIFKKNNNNSSNEDKVHQKDTKEKESKSKSKTERRKERKNNNGSSSGSAAELNINIWPFSRSRSAGTGGAPRPKPFVPTRRVSSAPCSRSNSRGESSTHSSSTTTPAAAATAVLPRRCAASPVRAGVPVGRSSPVWQMKRNKPIIAVAGGQKNNNGSNTSNGLKGLNLNLNVNTCIGYRTQMSCRRDDRELFDGSRGGGRSSGSGDGSTGGSLFSLKTIFSKKVIY